MLRTFFNAIRPIWMEPGRFAKIMCRCHKLGLLELGLSELDEHYVYQDRLIGIRFYCPRDNVSVIDIYWMHTQPTLVSSVTFSSDLAHYSRYERGPCQADILIAFNTLEDQIKLTDKSRILTYNRKEGLGMGMNDVDTALSDMIHYITQLRRIPGDEEIYDNFDALLEGLSYGWGEFRAERKKLLLIQKHRKDQDAKH